MRTTMFLLLTASTLGACKWTEFDDLEADTWVDSTGKPDVKSSDYGVAIQPGSDASESASGGTLAVIGAGPGSYSELAYDPRGSASLKTNHLALDAQGITSLDSPPILLASPASSELALVTTGDNGSIVVATGTHTLLLRQLFVTTTSLAPITISTTPDAATYMQPGAFPGGDPSPGPGPLVAVGDIVMGTIYTPPSGSPQPACRLVAGTNPVQVRALGVLDNGAIDDVLVWNGADGKLLRYPGSVYNGCTTQTPISSTGMAAKPAFVPGRGSQILTIGGSEVLLVGHEDTTRGNGGFLQVYDAATMLPKGNAVMLDGLRSAALLVVNTATYVVAGYPTEVVDGRPAGVVRVFRIGAGGLEPAPVATLADAQPEDNQSFGRAVAAMPYNGKQVIAVAADNEIFVYFRANLEDGTALYDETRQGR
jgi:hypothetical protein